MKLSVFRGGFTRDAAQMVTGATLQTLMSLMNKSLIRRDATSGRYEIHELLRQDAAERLALISNLADETRTHHAAYFAAFLHQRWKRLTSAALRETANEIEADFDNIRVAWRHLIAQSKLSDLRKAVKTLWWFLFLTNRHEDGLELLAHEPPIPLDNESEGRAVIWNISAALGWFYVMTGQPAKGKTLALESLDALIDTPKPEDRMLPLFTLAQATVNMGQIEETERASQESLSIAGAIRDDWMKAASSLYLALVATIQSDFTKALRHAEDCLKSADISGDPFARGSALRTLGNVVFDQGDYNEAKRLFSEALPLLEQSGQFYMMAFTRRSLGLVALRLEDYDESRNQLHQSLRLYDHNGQRWEMLNSIKEVTDLLIIQDKKVRAVELLALVHQHPNTFEGMRKVAEEILATLQGEMEGESYAAAYRRGSGYVLETVARELVNELSASSD